MQDAQCKGVFTRMAARIPDRRSWFTRLIVPNSADRCGRKRDCCRIRVARRPGSRIRRHWSDRGRRAPSLRLIAKPARIRCGQLCGPGASWSALRRSDSETGRSRTSPACGKRGPAGTGQCKRHLIDARVPGARGPWRIHLIEIKWLPSLLRSARYNRRLEPIVGTLAEGSARWSRRHCRNLRTAPPWTRNGRSRGSDPAAAAGADTLSCTPFRRVKPGSPRFCPGWGR